MLSKPLLEQSRHLIARIAVVADGAAAAPAADVAAIADKGGGRLSAISHSAYTM